MLKKIITAFVLCFIICSVNAQENIHDTLHPSAESIRTKDIGDVWNSIWGKKEKATATKKENKKYHIGVLPAIGYSLQTGWAVNVSSSIAFKTSNFSNQKLSSIYTSITQSQFSQTIFPFAANIWSKGNKLNYVTDFRFIKYPSDVYGLGRQTDPNQAFSINYTGLKFHQSIQKEIANNFALGVGIYYDQFWNIEALDSLKDVIAIRLSRRLESAERAVGIAFKATYDSRLNQINAKQGLYANVVFRPNFTFLGSDINWNNLQTDVRFYLPFPKKSKNVLAFWDYNVITLGATSPQYLMLPSTGWDDSYNTGRGYIQSRFRGKNMYYFETEYRVHLTKNDLLNGVVFCNLEKFSGDLARDYRKIKAAYGLGLRIKLNKYSNSNICLDYGFGENGSKGLFVNIGEVF
ncbi:MAG: BamA/TamA family outer membrane protein [Bacteroidetes bacterium]|nr:BamA/TamA family outer membrane protein [Bacteroidota bacterium]